MPDAVGATLCERCAVVPAMRSTRLLGALIDRTLLFVGGAVGVFIATKLSSGVDAYGFFVGLIGMLSVEVGLVARYQRSIGKLLVGTKIVKANGMHAEPWRAALLHTLLAKNLLGSVPLVNVVDQLWIFGPTSRCLHDVLSGTRVIAMPRVQHRIASA